MAVVTTTVDGPVLIVTINRPEVKNALDFEAMEALAAAWVELDSRENLKTAVVTGAGTDAFSSGADLKKVVDTFDSTMLQVPARALLADGVHHKPIVAAINGLCYGAGAILLLGTDYRIASETATFALTGVKLGAYAPFAGPALTAQVSYGTASRMLLLGEKIGSAEALTSGLVSEVRAPADLLDRAVDVARVLTTRKPSVLEGIRAVLAAARVGDSARALQADADAAGAPRS